MLSFSQLDTALDATAELERCAHFLDLEDWIVARLRQCEQEITLNTSFLRDDGSIRPLAAISVRHCSALGPSAVPLIISREASLDSERAHAMHSTWVAALYGLGAGGGAAAVILDPGEHSETELRSAIQKVGAAMAEVSDGALIFPNGLNSIEMEWLHSAFARHKGSAHIAGRLCSIPANPVKSLAYGFLELIRCATGRVHGIRVAVQGFDAICRELIQQLHARGAQLCAVADESGGLSDPLGLDPTALVAFHRDHGMLLGAPETKAVMNTDVLESDCDVLVLAANPNQVGQHNADRIRADVILEIAPQAIAGSAKPILLNASKTIVSNLLCNGVAMLYYASESHCRNLVSAPAACMRKRVRRTWSEIQQAALKWSLPPFQAAEMLAVQRVAEAVRVHETERRR
jgi:glutamate dehydrogenase/leucine dehydrogenase